MPIDILKTIEIAKKIIRLQCDYIYKKNGNKISEKDIKIEVKKELESKIQNYANLDSLINEISDWVQNLYQTKSGETLGLSDDTDHIEWLEKHPDRVREKPYWEIYRQWLKAEENFSESSIVDIDKSTEKILSKLEDPKRPGNWDRRGVVIGSVQSGKTANFIGLINKARDAGYKFIVILSGTNNDLRQQTQERIDDGYIGYYTSDYSSPNSPRISNPLGTARQERFAESHQWPLHGTFNELNGDFNKSAFEHLAKQNLNEGSTTSYIFVIKNNQTPLKRLIQWLAKHTQSAPGAFGFDRMPPLNETNTKDPPFIKDFPLLLLDDECDHYSVDTGIRPRNPDGSFDEEYDPRKINGLIRKLLFCFSRRCYVGYTATPFANVFIAESAYAKNYGPDLFPKSFMFDVRPPSNHQGLETLFSDPDNDDIGPSQDQSNFIITIRDFCNDPNDLGCDEGWIPYRHNKEHIPIYDHKKGVLDEDLLDMDTLNFYLEIVKFSQSNRNEKIELPPSIIHAVMSFIIASTIRNVRSLEQIGQHKSMLIHVTKFINVQERIEGEIHNLIDSILDVLKYKKERFFDCLKHIYENYFLKHTKEYLDQDKNDITFEQLRYNEKGIEWIIKEIKNNIYRMSGHGGNKPNYRAYKKDKGIGITTIVIGGDKLSRGVTFNGLSTSYFLRGSRMYDTLMQMGRWFGYRPGYEDVCRLYTSNELRQNFIDINIASEELRGRVSYMQRMGRTPSDFGLAVQSSPGLLITSRVKMRDGIELNIDYSGSGRQMTTLPWNIEKIAENFDLTSNFIKNLKKESEGHSIKRDWGKIPFPEPVGIQHYKQTVEKSYIWEKVGYNAIIDYLLAFNEHPNSIFNAEHISKYITDAVGQNYLKEWNVVLLGNGNSKKDATIGGKEVYLIERMPSGDSSAKESKASFGAIWDPTHEALDIDKEDYLKAWLAAEKNKSEKERNTEIKFSQEIRRKRSPNRGVILIYPLVPVIREIVKREIKTDSKDFKKDLWNPFKRNIIRKHKSIKEIDERKPLISIALSLPEISDHVSIPYVGNNRYYEEEYGRTN